MGVFGSYILFYKEKIFVDQPIIEIIRLIDIRQREIDYTESQLGSEWRYCDLEARDVFRAGISASILKCIAGFNYHGKRYKIINKRMTRDEYPR